MAPVIDRAILLVAHGSPSDPLPQELAIGRLAASVARLLPGHAVRGATLAAPGELDRALACAPSPDVYPVFMSDGWFVSDHLPRRLAKAGAHAPRILPPLGRDPGLPNLVLERLSRMIRHPGHQTLVVAAHGSPSDPRPRQAAEALARQIHQSRLVGAVRTGFVDEAPGIETVAQVVGPAICLPFFAARAGHVQSDLPAALAAASFAGEVLPPLGQWPEIPALIAQSLRRAHGEMAA